MSCTVEPWNMKLFTMDLYNEPEKYLQALNYTHTGYRWTKFSMSLSSNWLFKRVEKKIRNQPSRLTTLFSPHWHLGFPGFFRHPIVRDISPEVHRWLWLHHYSWPEGHHHWPYRGKELLTKQPDFLRQGPNEDLYWPKQHINQEHQKKETKMKNIFATSLECSGLERCGCIYVCILTLLSCFFFVCRCLQTKGCIYGIGGWHNLNTNGLKEWLSNPWATWFERMNHTGVHLSCIMLPHFTHHVLHILYCTGTWIAWFTHHILYDYCIAGFSKYHCKVYSIYVNITLIPKNFDRYPQWWSGKYISFPSWVSPFQVGYTVYHGISCSLYSGLVAPFECYMYGHRLSRRMWRLKSLRNLGCDSCIFIAMKWTTFSTNNCLPLKLGLLPPPKKEKGLSPFFTSFQG